MPKQRIDHPYSRYSRDAVRLLGGLIQTARKERKLTVQNIAERAGISRGLLQRIEKGDMKCQIGAVFEVAAILGISLFDANNTTLPAQLRHIEEKLVLLPKSIRARTKQTDDDF